MLKHFTLLHRRTLVLLCLSFFLLSTLHAQTIYYVTTTGNDANSGTTSWSNAFKTLQKALATAGSNSQIWVAKGSYYPDEGVGITNNNRSTSFVMKNNVAIYGGFAGTETLLNQRNWQTNITILSGDIDQNDGSNFQNNSGNSYHVVLNSNNGLNNTAVLDGFSIAAGNGSIDGPTYGGGGMYNMFSSPAIINCIFSGNRTDIDGGGMYNNFSSPTLTNCSFSGNKGHHGGGLYNYSSSPTLINCKFSGNDASVGGGMSNDHSPSITLTNCSFSQNTATFGGGMENNSSSPTLTNCSFWGNNVSYRGGGMYNEFSSSPTLTNCSFSLNSVTYNNYPDGIGGGLNNQSSSNPILVNCIFWGNGSGEIINYNGSNPTITYSIVQGGYTGTGNIDQDPLFVNSTSSNLRLASCSPAINKGSNAANSTSLDLDANPRINGGTIDMGAYETQNPVCCPTGGILYVNNNATGTNNGTSWTNAFTNLQDALASTCSNINQIWVAKGKYYPDEGGGKTNNDRTASFVLKNNIAIYGGFAGTETNAGDRNWKINVTTLSGDIDQNDGNNFTNNSGNSYHVVLNYNNGLNNTAILDGFTITAGNGNGNSLDNSGGGILNYSSSPTLMNCSFSGNYAAFYGGGIYNAFSSTPKLTNCSFLANNAFIGGGAIYNSASSTTLTNCSFSGNNASNAGGGIFNASSSPTLTNCSFSGNNASSGGGIYNSSSSPTLTNCILWGDGGVEISNFTNSIPTITYSLVQGQNPGGTNLDGTNIANSPLFVQQPIFNSAPTTSGNLRLMACSPVLNKGNDAANSTTTDLDGNTRKVGTIDLGAYEFQPGSGTPSNATDYFRTVSTGSWNTPCTWESSPDNVNWHGATITPDFQAMGVFIQNGFIINVTADITIGPITLNPGGNLNVKSGVKLTIKP